MSATARLAELGITLPPVSTPVGSYVPAVRTGSLVYTSGQVPKDATKGKVGAEVSAEDANAAARVCALQALAGAPGFTGQPAVINGASDLLREVFGEAGAHARSAVGVAELPGGVPVEVELIVEVR